MANKFDYENMLNRIRDSKVTPRTEGFTIAEMDAWNNAVELCYNIVEKRRQKFEQKESKLPIYDVSSSFSQKDMENFAAKCMLFGHQGKKTSELLKDFCDNDR